MNQVFNNENKSVTGSNQDISKELEEIRWMQKDKKIGSRIDIEDSWSFECSRDSRPTPVTKRWRPPQQTRVRIM